MIKVIVSKENNKIKKVVMSGHANYDEYGKDIVCASASSIVITTINSIIEINKNWINYALDEKLILELNEHNEILDKLVDNMLNMLQELANDYQKNISIKEE